MNTTEERFNQAINHYDFNKGELKKMILLDEEQNKKDEGENKKYLLLYNFYEDGEEYRTYEFITGRDNIYEFIKSMILDDDTDLDVESSTVILSTSPVDSGISVYKFMKIMEKRYPDDNFCIDNYVKGDII